MSTITLLFPNGKFEFKLLLLSFSGLSHLYNPTASAPWKVSCCFFNLISLAFARSEPRQKLAAAFETKNKNQYMLE